MIKSAKNKKDGKISKEVSNEREKYSFQDYQQHSRKTALYKKIGHSVVYPTLGLAGETGEVVDKIKKVIRNNDGKFSVEDKIEITKELGDVLWYLSQIASELNIKLEDVAKENIKKLYDRLERDVLHSSGDNR